MVTDDVPSESTVKHFVPQFVDAFDSIVIQGAITVPAKRDLTQLSYPPS
jgi:hypothetical protein